MTTYQIISSAGVDMGTFEGETEAEALDAMARDAGYASQADAEAQGVPPFDGMVREVGAAAAYEYKWSTGSRWEPVAGATEREAADRVASLVGGTCPVPGAYRQGRERAKRRRDGSWVMPTGAVILIRRR